jgi:hypothetical protein
VRKERDSKWSCQCCGHTFVDGEFLQATSPFRDDDVLIACPKCRMTEGFDELCDVEGCTQHASCGTPIKGGFVTFSGDDDCDDYLRTCGKHRNELTEMPPNPPPKKEQDARDHR